MKTITIDDKKIEISDESYEAFKKQFVIKDKATLWKPTVKEQYYRIDPWGKADLIGANNSMRSYDLEIGNVYKTNNEAEEALKTGWIAKRKAEVEILRFIAENDLEYDWLSGEDNYCICYGHYTCSFTSDISRAVQKSILPYFKASQDAQKVIDAMAPQLKILFGVKG